MALAYGHYLTAVYAASATIWHTVTLTGDGLNAHKCHDVSEAAPSCPAVRVSDEDFLSATAEPSQASSCRQAVPQTSACANVKDPPFG